MPRDASSNIEDSVKITENDIASSFSFDSMSHRQDVLARTFSILSDEMDIGLCLMSTTFGCTPISSMSKNYRLGWL